jgi:hypothetical protein
MSEPLLVLFTRKGCCLCEGLEEKLRALVPPPRLRCIDVDGDPVLRGRYGLEVPVLAVGPATAEPASLSPLPRPSPRLQGEALGRWLEARGVHRDGTSAPFPT